jgi:hypothetical protein
MKTQIGCFLLVVAAAVGYQGYVEFALGAALFGVIFLVHGNGGDASIGIGFGGSDDGCGGGCGGD